MYEAPPPYSGIGPDHAPYPAGGYQQANASAPPAYNDAVQAPPLPTKAWTNSSPIAITYERCIFLIVSIGRMLGYAGDYYGTVQLSLLA